MAVSRPAGDTGAADPAVAAALSAYGAGEGTEYAALTAIAASRLLVPVVAVLVEGNADGTEKETEMALPTLIGNDGRTAIIAFTSTDTIKRWRPDARPVPVPARNLWPAVEAEQAAAVVVDVGGPVPFVIEGARLAALSAGHRPPPAHEDPDVRAAIAQFLDAFSLGPGDSDADLAITIDPRDMPKARTAIARLAPRLRRIQLRTANTKPSWPRPAP